MAAKLPPELVERPKPQLQDVQIGTTVYISDLSMGVDSDGQCHLRPDAPLSSRTSSSIQVTRFADGFHVTVISKDSSWKLGEIIPGGWLPVESIKQDLDPELDSERKLAEIRALLKSVQSGSP
jgi:hypothetical protein